MCVCICMCACEGDLFVCVRERECVRVCGVGGEGGVGVKGDSCLIGHSNFGYYKSVMSFLPLFLSETFVVVVSMALEM